MRHVANAMNFMRAALFPLMIIPTLAAATDAPRPIVVELFTSQGCSSCPPADALLTQMRDDPGLLPLDLHVTYWDRLGWKDPFSVPAATLRQRQFAAQFGLDAVYTPQMVIDGRYEVVGSDPAAIRAALGRARAAAASVPLRLVQEGARLHVHVAAGTGAGTVVVVGYDTSHTTAVRGGENGGRTLTEINVVRTLSPAGTWSGQLLDITVAQPGGEHAAVLLQGEDGHILGAATLP